MELSNLCMIENQEKYESFQCIRCEMIATKSQISFESVFGCFCHQTLLDRPMKPITVKIFHYKLGKIVELGLERILNGKAYLYDMDKVYMEVANFKAEVQEDTLKWMAPTKDYLDTLFRLYNGEDNPLLSDVEGMKKIVAAGSHTSMSVGDIVMLHDGTFEEYWRLGREGWVMFARNRFDRINGCLF